jgi:hypothetical protein
MKKEGAIILGVGGDNSDGGVGTFLEGVITKVALDVNVILLPPCIFH